MKPTEQLEIVPQTGAVATVPASQGLSLDQAWQDIKSGDFTAEKLAVMERMLAISRESQFNAAFAKLQSELPVIVAQSVIPNRGKYQRFEDIMQKDGVGAILARNGFSVSFSQDFKEGRVVVTCFLSHSAGHTRPTSYGVRVGGKSDSETQADCKASTTAKRNALCQALNLVIRQDCLNEEEDAGLEGNPNKFVTPEQADEIERRAQLVNANIPALLEYAKAKSFATIQANRYDDLDELLKRKEGRR